MAINHKKLFLGLTIAMSLGLILFIGGWVGAFAFFVGAAAVADLIKEIKGADHEKKEIKQTGQS